MRRPTLPTPPRAPAVARLIPLLLLFPAATGPAAVTYKDVTQEAGITFRHVNGASGEKYYIETMGSGACWLDYDADGDIDLYVVNSAGLPGYVPARGAPDPANVLYRNNGDGTFTDVTGTSGTGDRGYGMGCVAGDIDNDGDTDLYVTNFGPNVMYRNEGGGRFTDITTSSRTGDPRWSASAAMADVDGDGALDLYVTNYLDFTLENNKLCSERPGLRSYCHPDEYNGVPDSLYRNLGNGVFEETGAAAGIANPIGKGLGVVFTDLDLDGDVDIYVANDKTINFLYANRGNGTFEDRSILSGTGFSESGAPQAGMGTDAGDVNGDGLMDLIVTNLDYETNELYINGGNLSFTDATFARGLGAPNFLRVGFGADFMDHDNDGDRDLLIVNGHILDDIEKVRDQVTYAQPRSLLVNDGTGLFREPPTGLGPDFHRPAVGRGLAVGDYDNDGDLDIFVVNSNQRADLLRNDGGNDPAAGGGHWLILTLRGTRGNRDGVGARVRVLTRDGGVELWQTEEARRGSSYLSGNDPRLHFGLGRAVRAEAVEIRWPAGTIQRLENVAADRVMEIVEPGE